MRFVSVRGGFQLKSGSLKRHENVWIPAYASKQLKMNYDAFLLLITISVLNMIFRRRRAGFLQPFL